MRNKEELVEQTQRAQEEQLEKLAGIAEGRSQQWLQQKTEMEQHYSQLLDEIHTRHKVTAVRPFNVKRDLSIVIKRFSKTC